MALSLESRPSVATRIKERFVSVFPLPLFPENSLAASVTTTVWIGVWVVAFYNLRLGWPLSGLVVPGYLVPLLLVKPVAAGVILAEAVLTYVVVATISEWRHVKPWTSFFGRDRFFALVLTSILVRGAMDGWVLPAVGDALTFHYGWQLSFRDNLHSFGLIIVSLVANYFWKPGIVRGLIPLTVTVGTTYLVVRFGLMELTNFSMGNLQYMYEEISSSLLACPKAYIVLVTTAYIASQMNLYYGWDFNGILIPALLALQWQEPFKLVTTMVEAFAILGVATALLRLPVFQRTTIEGARKTLLFFNIAFAFRLGIGFAAPMLFPETKVTDLFGFGYLLSTLLAVRMHSNGLLLRIPRVSLQVSLVGAVAGTMIGFVMSRTFDAWSVAGAAPLQAATVVEVPSGEPLVDLLRAEKIRLYRHRAPGSLATPRPNQLSAFSQGMSELLASCEERDDVSDSRDRRIRRARELFEQANFELVSVGSRYLLVREREPMLGWGTYVIDTECPDGVAVEVPCPREEWGAAEAGLVLFRRLSGRAIAIAGADRTDDGNRTPLVLSHPDTIFGVFHRSVAAANVIVVRGDRSRPRRPSDGASRVPWHRASIAEQSRLWVNRSLPGSLDLKLLEGLVPGFLIEWRAAPQRDALRDESWAGHAELRLNRTDADRLLAALSHIDEDDPADGNDRADGNDPADTGVSAIPVTVGGWMRGEMDLVLERGSQLFRPALPEQLFYFDEEVIRPLLEIVSNGTLSSAWTPEDRRRLVSTAAAAGVLNYRLQLLVDQETGVEMLALSEDPALKQRRGWGAYLFRLGDAKPCGIEIPRPVLEQWTSECGLSLFRSMNARLLMVAGAHPQANSDGTADVIPGSNAMTLYNLVRQAVVRDFDPLPWRQVQVRGISVPIDADVLVAPTDHVLDANAFADVFDGLRADGLRVRMADGAEEAAGYESMNSLLAGSLRLGRGSHGMILWLSPNMRTQFRARDDDALQAAEFQAVEIQTVQTSAAEHLSILLAKHGDAFEPCAFEFQQIASAYLASRNVIELRRLQRLWRGAVWTRLLDSDSGQTYLVGHDDRQLLIVCLAELPAAGPRIMECRRILPETVREFVDRRATWLQPEGEAP
jgi:hypothetical protein